MGRIFNRLGLHAFVINDYQSLIRGGHNFCRIRAADRQVWNYKEEVDLVAALNQETITKHESALLGGGGILFDSDKAKYSGVAKNYPIPLTAMVKEVGGTPIMRNSAMVGAIAWLYGIPLDVVNVILEWAYGKKAEKNIILAQKGHDHAKPNFAQILKVAPVKREPTHFISGTEAMVLGAVKAGMKIYIAYPMTPTTRMLTFAAANADELGIVTVQPENEICAANLALGAAYAGVRSVVGTAGGGFALMQETFSMSGQSEIPAVFVVGQRPAPAIGLPTYTSQADLKFLINAGHGEFPRIVVAPGDPEEAFVKTGEVMNLAWKHQVPAIVITDKHQQESYMSIAIDEGKVSVEQPGLAEGWEGEYKRYKFTESGVSPMAFPGKPGAVVKVTGYEHDEDGYPIEGGLMDKRMGKMKGTIDDLKKRETVKAYGGENAENLIVAWGSTKGAVIEAMRLIDKPLKFLHMIYLTPFPDWEVMKHLEKAKHSVCIEANMTGQLRSYIREQTGHLIDKSILKYDGRQFDPTGLAKEIKGAFEWK